MAHSESPWKIAVIGAGPAGFYAAEHLLKQSDPAISVDMFDRLPTPYGLVRAGVAPDHEKIKNVTRIFDKTAEREGFRFFGNVNFGTDLTLDDLQQHYHQVYFSTGAQVDRSLGIDGEALPRSHSATEFVAWYNGHPDFRDLHFDLTQERVVVIGVGNVAVDVARILCRTADELRKTDIADYALEQLAESQVRDIVMIGRRGPAQAAFTLPEIKELGHMEDAGITTHADDMELDEYTRAQIEADPDRSTTKKLEIMRSYIGGSNPAAEKQCTLRFLLSPIEIHAGTDGGVERLTVMKNRLEPGRGNRLSAVATGNTMTLPCGLVFRSVGYHGVALPGIPFREDWGTVPNEGGRVIEPDGSHVKGVYVGGWIKRGPTGIIGTNKPDAIETATCMLEDLAAGALFAPEEHDIADTLRERDIRFVTYADWHRIDALETEKGREQGRPRVKLTRVEDMLSALSPLP